jgi:hypothetical protein
MPQPLLMFRRGFYFKRKFKKLSSNLLGAENRTF